MGIGGDFHYLGKPPVGDQLNAVQSFYLRRRDKMRMHVLDEKRRRVVILQQSRYRRALVSMIDDHGIIHAMGQHGALPRLPMRRRQVGYNQYLGAAGKMGQCLCRPGNRMQRLHLARIEILQQREDAVIIRRRAAGLRENASEQGRWLAQFQPPTRTLQMIFKGDEKLKQHLIGVTNDHWVCRIQRQGCDLPLSVRMK